MIRRVGLRRLLPITFTFVHLMLLLYAAAHQPQRLSGNRSDVTYHMAAYQEGVPMTVEPMVSRRLTPTLKVAALLNLPALLAGILVSSILSFDSDLSFLCVSTPFVPLVWYGVGHWIDGLVGNRPRLVQPPGPWHGPSMFLSCTLLCVSILAITPINDHRTSDTYWIAAAEICWAALLVAISASAFARRSPT